MGLLRGGCQDLGSCRQASGLNHHASRWGLAATNLAITAAACHQGSARVPMKEKYLCCSGVMQPACSA